MKCKDCCARNGEDVCLIGKKPRMLVCGHYGCDLQQRTVEKRMGIEKPMTNADRIRAMTDEELAAMIGQGCPPNSAEIDCNNYICDDETKCALCWLDWLRKEADS